MRKHTGTPAKASHPRQNRLALVPCRVGILETLNAKEPFFFSVTMHQIYSSAEVFLNQRFDYIVVGGGTAGLAVASRLAERQDLQIGVLEAGGSIEHDDNVRIPAFYGRAISGENDWCFQTVAQAGLGGRKLPWPRGKALGGTSSLNFMTWVRASRADYDAWEALGNAGWGWDSLL